MHKRDSKLFEKLQQKLTKVGMLFSRAEAIAAGLVLSVRPQGNQEERHQFPVQPSYRRTHSLALTPVCDPTRVSEK